MPGRRAGCKSARRGNSLHNKLNEVKESLLTPIIALMQSSHSGYDFMQRN
jgi:hypothetical protein